MPGSNIDLIEKILYHVEKPGGRYVGGGELNQIVKESQEEMTKWCLIFLIFTISGKPISA